MRVCVHVCLRPQSCPTLCNLMDCSLPGSSVNGIFQARTLEWVAISFSRGSSLPKDRTQVSCTASRFSTIWATREAHGTRYFLPYYASHFADGKTEAERYIVWGMLQGWEQTQVHLGLLSTVVQHSPGSPWKCFNELTVSSAWIWRDSKNKLKSIWLKSIKPV